MRHIDPMEWGRLIGRFEADRDNDRRRLDDHEERLTDVEQTVSSYTTWATRGGLLVLLWAGALMINLNPEQKAEAFSMILKHLAK